MSSQELLLKIGVNNTVLANAFDKYCSKFGIDGEEKLYLIANCYHESGGFKLKKENLNYSEQALISLFSYFKNNKQEAKLYARNQVEIGKRIYANRLGNGDVSSGDGYKYLGRSFIQITGRANYKQIGDKLGLDLISNPELLEQDEYAVASSCAFYKLNVMPCTSIEQSRKKINGTAMLGLKEVKEIYIKMKS